MDKAQLSSEIIEPFPAPYRLTRQLIRQFLAFSGCGAIGTALHYTALIVLVELVGSDSVPASVAGFVLGAISNYLLNYNFTFRSRLTHFGTLQRFLTVAFVGLLVNSGLMYLVAHRLGFPYLLAQMLATGTVLFWSFAANRSWTFRETTPR